MDSFYHIYDRMRTMPGDEPEDCEYKITYKTLDSCYRWIAQEKMDKRWIEYYVLINNTGYFDQTPYLPAHKMTWQFLTLPGLA